MQKLNQLTKKQYKALNSIILKDFQADKKAFRFVYECYKHHIIAKDLPYALDIGKLDDIHIIEIQTCLDLLKTPRMSIISHLIQKMRPQARRKLFLTYQYDPLERWLFSVLCTAKKENRVVGTKTLLYMLESKKGVKMSDIAEKYYTKLINRIRKRIYRIDCSKK